MNYIMCWGRKNCNVGAINYSYNPRKVELSEKSNNDCIYRSFKLLNLPLKWFLFRKYKNHKIQT